MQLDLLEHAKFKLLCRHLELPRPQVVGLLEMLWANAAAHAKGDCCATGPLYRPGHIEIIVDWTGAPGALERSLLDLRWTDPAEGGCRLHDFAVHCPKFVKERRERYHTKPGIPGLHRAATSHAEPRQAALSLDAPQQAPPSPREEKIREDKGRKVKVIEDKPIRTDTETRTPPHTPAAPPAAASVPASADTTQNSSADKSPSGESTPDGPSRPGPGPVAGLSETRPPAPGEDSSLGFLGALSPAKLEKIAWCARTRTLDRILRASGDPPACRDWWDRVLQRMEATRGECAFEEAVRYAENCADPVRRRAKDLGVLQRPGAYIAKQCQLWLDRYGQKLPPAPSISA